MNTVLFNHRSLPLSLCLSVAFAVGLHDAGAVQVSATYDPSSFTSHMGFLPHEAGVNYDPTPADSGTAGLAAPVTGTNTDTQSFAYPGTAPGTPAPLQMYGDAISSITALGSGAYQIEITLTNFWFEQGTPQSTLEQVHVNVWETFTGLGSPALWSTSGMATLSGTVTVPNMDQAAGTGESVVFVYDPITTSWVSGSPILSGGAVGNFPGGPIYPISASSGTLPLGSYVSGGQLVIGLQAGPSMLDFNGAGGVFVNLPNSLHLSVILTPVPEPATFGMLVIGVCCMTAIRRTFYQKLCHDPLGLLQTS